jgi:hypothetical protein
MRVLFPQFAELYEMRNLPEDADTFVAAAP